jgi:hypothetical protein
MKQASAQPLAARLARSCGAGRMTGVAVLLIALTACEAIESDYQGMFGEDPVPERITGPTAADRDAPEPNLASVPRHHPKYQSSAVREDQRADLEADIKRAEYSTVPPQVNIDRDQAARPATDGQVTPGKGELLGIIQFAEGSAKLDDRDRAIGSAAGASASSAMPRAATRPAIRPKPGSPTSSPRPSAPAAWRPP